MRYAEGMNGMLLIEILLEGDVNIENNSKFHVRGARAKLLQNNIPV